MKTSSFERLARSVVVEDLCESAKCLDVDPWNETIGALLERHALGPDCAHDPAAPLLLRMKQEFDDDGHPAYPSAFPFAVLLPRRAWLDAVTQTGGGERYLETSHFDDLCLEEPCPAVARFGDKNILSGNVSLWELITSDGFAISANGAALIVRGIGQYGVLTIDELMHRPEAKSCWLTATLDLERAALQVCKQGIAKATGALGQDRVKAAVERFDQRLHAIKEEDRASRILQLFARTDVEAYFGKISRDPAINLYSLILDHTQFADKKTMLLKGGFDLPASNTKIKSVFEKAEKLRNWCAHPTSEPELRIEHLGELRAVLLDIHKLANELQHVAEKLDRESV